MLMASSHFALYGALLGGFTIIGLTNVAIMAGGTFPAGSQYLDKNSKFPLYFYGVIIFFNIFFTAF
jgi:hypothetical protein